MGGLKSEEFFIEVMRVRSGDVQVGLLGDLSPAEIGGYYYTVFGINTSNPLKDCGLFTPLVVLLTKSEKINAKVRSSTSLDLVLKDLPTLLDSEPRRLARLYIIPHNQTQIEWGNNYE